jgi:DNA-binding transcriptional regulator YhcF (GntR family)
MSYTQISNDILSHIADLQLTPYDVLVYIVLKMYDYGRGYAYPSVRTVCKITGLSLGTIVKSVKRLQTAGLISIKKQKNRNIYTFYETPVSNKEESVVLHSVDILEQQPQVEDSSHLFCKDDKGMLYEGVVDGGQVILTQACEVSSPDQRVFLKIPLYKFLSSFMEVN